MKSSLFALAFVVGCGGGGSSSEPVVVNAAGTKLAAVHDGNTWKPLALDAQGKATISVDGPTLIATVCDNAELDFMDYYTIGIGPSDTLEELEMFCGETLTASQVTIVGAPTTTVYASFQRTNGGDSMAVAKGTYDIVAVDTSMVPPRVEVRRGVTITADTTLTFDLAATGTPMQKVRVDVTGQNPGELVGRNVSLTVGPRTLPTRANWNANGTDAFIVPPSLLKPDDKHVVAAGTGTETGSRSASRDVTGTETSVTLALPQAIATATFTFGAAPSLAWQGDPRFDSLYLGLNDPEFTKIWDIALLPSWAEAGGDRATITIPDPRAVPGWSPAWDITSTGLEWFMFASHDAAPDHISASRSGTL